jgi:uncharacterized membrane protein
MLAAHMLWAASTVVALMRVPYRVLNRGRVQHLILGSIVGLIGAWHLHAGIMPGLDFHFLIMTTVTLLLGWALAMVVGSLAALAMVLVGAWSGQVLALEILASVLVPVLTTSLLLKVSLDFWPTQPFAYIFCGAFFGGALAAAGSVFTRVVMLALSGVYALPTMTSEYLPFLPLYAFPEAILNGMLITVLVVYQPTWLRTYRIGQER